jgi:hypothetical protein
MRLTMSADLQISLPNWPMNRLLKEACASWSLRLPADQHADPVESDWRLLVNVCHSYIRHNFCAYDEALAQGANRDSLREQIGHMAATTFPWLRAEHDPRLDQVESPRKDSRPFNNFSRQLSDLVTERSRLSVAINLERRKRASGWREHVAELEERLAKVSARIDRLNVFFKPAIEKEAGHVYVNSMGCFHAVPGYDFGGRVALPESYTKSAGFRCALCEKTVMRTKTGIDHGAGKRLVAFSCHCFSLSIEIKAAFAVNFDHWQKSVAKHDQSTNIVVSDEHGVIYGHALARDIIEGRKQPKDAKVFKGAIFNAFVALLTVKFPEHAAVRALREAETATPAMLERVSAEIVLKASDIAMLLECQERFATENPTL